jgi:hypothetical protein
LTIPQNLVALFENLPLLDDTDGDGYPDRIALGITVHPNLEDPFVWAGLLNLTARLAFEVVALRLPLLQRGARPTPHGIQLVVYPPGHATPCAKRKNLPPACSCKVSRAAYLCGASGEAMMEYLNDLTTGHESTDARCCGTKTLSHPTSTTNRALDLLDLACLYEAPAHRPRSRELKAILSIPRHKISNLLGIALSDLVARLALDATDLTLPLVFVAAPKRTGIVLRVQEEGTKGNEIRTLHGKQSGRRTLVLKGDKRSLSRAIKSWSSWGFAAGGEGCEGVDLLRDHVEAFCRLLSGEGYWGKWSRFLLRHPGMDSISMPPACGKRYAVLAKACRALSTPAPPREKPPKTLHRTARWQSETTDVLNRIRQVPRGHGTLDGIVFLSKPVGRRIKLKARLEKILKARGYKPRLRVLNAYKPGLSWLLEEVLPRLKAIGPLASLEVSYQPFQGQENALEMRSRWLQEMFPGPDMLARALSIPPHRIKIRCRAGLKAIYEIRAFDTLGHLRFKEHLSPPFTRFPYLQHETERGFVHPSTGGILLKQEGRVFLDAHIPTDRERFWQIFQTRWIPLLEAFMADRLKNEVPGGQHAFWEDISVRVNMEETDLPLPLGEERICPLEALHEDLYFVLLQFFSSFARDYGIGGSVHLGRILPRVKNLAAKSPPYAKLTAKPMIWHRAPGRNIHRFRQVPSVSAGIMVGGQWKFEVRVPKTDMEAGRFLTLARAWGYKVTRAQNGSLLLWVKAPAIKQKGFGPTPVHEPAGNRSLKAREVTGLIRRLGRSPQLRAWCASRSLQGRPIYALEAFSSGDDSLPSLSKIRLLKPTLFFNARHHANEVSGTNATLRMAWRMAATHEGRAILRHVNVVWIPMENVDGVATFEELLSTGKDHILHAARYNALGVEFYENYFEPSPLFPEAKAKTRLWHRWLPEIMVDHHGVPSHEWNQPFSGYAPFNFREFWIPRSFVYACIPFVNEPRHKLHKTAGELSALLGEAMAEESNILRQNQEIASRYHRYARNPEPRTFPDSKGEPMLVVPPLGRTYNTNFAVRYPHVTRSEIVLEVPDEVAKGAHLELCVTAHIKAEEALIRAFKRAKGRIEAALDRKTGFLRLLWVPGKAI